MNDTDTGSDEYDEYDDDDDDDDDDEDIWAVMLMMREDHPSHQQSVPKLSAKCLLLL